MLTATEIFRRVVDGLIGQGLVQAGTIDAVTGSFRCSYRAPQKDGGVFKCAAGLLMPDEDYKEEFEGGACNSPDCSAGLYFRDKFPGHGDMLANLQQTHDFTLRQGKRPWAQKMLELYKRYEINCPITLIKLHTIESVG